MSRHLDEGVNPEQRDALTKIFGGQTADAV